MINANLMFWNQLDYTPLNDLDQEISVVADRMKFYGQGTFEYFTIETKGR